MQTHVLYVRGGNDPAVSELNWDRAFNSGGKFDLYCSPVAHMMRTTSSQSQWKIVSKGTKTSWKIRGAFSPLPANDTILNARW